MSNNFLEIPKIEAELVRTWFAIYFERGLPPAISKSFAIGTCKARAIFWMLPTDGLRAARSRSEM